MTARDGTKRAAMIAGGAGVVVSVLLASWALRAPVAPPMPEPEAVPAVSLPSGQQAELMEAFWEDQGGGEIWLRLRFLAPWLDDTGDAAVVAQDDMLHLCREVGLPYVAQAPHAVGLVIVSLSARPIDFGVTDAGIVQFFEAYELLDGDCMSEEFDH